MELKGLNVNRFIYKMDPSEVEENPVFMSSQIGSNRNRTDQNNKNTSYFEKGAREIITGTVIMNCIIITSALPNRIEIANNDITFYDDTVGSGGTFRGDTSRLIFTRADRDEGTFIMEKRVSINDTFDSVLSWYVTAPVEGHHNWMFIGRDGVDTPENKNLSVLRISINGEPTDDVSTGKPYGSYSVEYCEESVQMNVPIFAGSSRNFIGAGLSGSSSYISASDGGITGLAYYLPGSGAQYVMLYLLDETKIMLGADLIPDSNGAYDIGAPGAKIGTLYGSVAACPLPTVENAISILKKIPSPSKVGERGHYGDRLYFDDLTFPSEILFTDKKGRTDIEHNHLLGFLVQVVRELNDKVESLEAQLSN